jgi:uncharacterized protein YgiB involved in biofilm formation
MNSFWKVSVVSALLLGPVFTLGGCKENSDNYETLGQCIAGGYSDQDCITIVQRNTARVVSQNPSTARSFTSLQDCELTYGVGQCGRPATGTVVNNTYVTEQVPVFAPLVMGMYLGWAMSDPYSHVIYSYNVGPRPIYSRSTTIIVQGARPPAQAALQTRTLRSQPGIVAPPPARGGLGSTAQSSGIARPGPANSPAVAPATQKLSPSAPPPPAAKSVTTPAPAVAPANRGGFGSSASRPSSPPPAVRSSGGSSSGGSRKR